MLVRHNLGKDCTFTRGPLSRHRHTQHHEHETMNIRQASKTVLMLTLMIFRQTSMPVFVSRAWTALLKAADPKKSMT